MWGSAVGLDNQATLVKSEPGKARVEPQHICKSVWSEFSCVGDRSWKKAEWHQIYILNKMPASLVAQMAQMVKNLPAVQETRVQSLGQDNPLEKGMPTHSSILAWRITRMEEHGGQQSMGPQRIGHGWATTAERAIISSHLEDPQNVVKDYWLKRGEASCFNEDSHRSRIIGRSPGASGNTTRVQDRQYRMDLTASQAYSRR